MENLKEKLPMLVFIIIAIAIGAIGLYQIEFGEEIYYTQIDNTKIEKISSSDSMKYKYTLIGYREDGKEKELDFKTTRKLREAAYLELEVKPISGVHSWKEVQYNELPEKVKLNYTES